jgi:hypothetical protein
MNSALFELHTSAELRACVNQCSACVNACQACGDACLHNDGVLHLLVCIQLAGDCGEACVDTARELAAGQFSSLRESCTECVARCIACARECERHDLDECRACAAACRACASASRQQLQSVASISA